MALTLPLIKKITRAKKSQTSEPTKVYQRPDLQSRPEDRIYKNFPRGGGGGGSSGSVGGRQLEMSEEEALRLDAAERQRQQEQREQEQRERDEAQREQEQQEQEQRQQETETREEQARRLSSKRLRSVEGITTPEQFRATFSRTSAKVLKRKRKDFGLGVEEAFEQTSSGNIIIPDELKPQVRPAEDTLLTRARAGAEGRVPQLVAEAVTPIASVGALGIGLIRTPRETITGVGLGLKETGSRFLSGKGFPEIGQMAQSDPLRFTARAAGEVALFKGTQFVVVKGAPQIRGASARIEPSFRGVRTTEGLGGFTEQVIPNVNVVGDIGLIPAGKVSRVPKRIGGRTAPPTLRGGFGFSSAEQAEFIGAKGVTTSQRGFLPRFRKKAEIVEIEKGYGFFGTPSDPITSRPQTRISRLGETPKPAKIRDIIAGDITLKSPQPQILIFPKEVVGRKGGFQPFGMPGTELEAVTAAPSSPGAPKVVIKKRKLGVTAIGSGFGRRVPIFETELDTSVVSLRKGIDTISVKRIQSKKFGKGDSTSIISSKKVVSPSSIGGVGSSLLPSSRILSGVTVALGGFSGGGGVSRTPYGDSVVTVKPIPTGESGLSPGGSVPFLVPSGPPSPPPIIPGQLFPRKPPVRFEYPLGFKEKKGRITKPRKLKRQVSLAALELNIVGDIKPGLERTGIFERPIPVRRKSKRRKK